MWGKLEANIQKENAYWIHGGWNENWTLCTTSIEYVRAPISSQNATDDIWVLNLK